MLVVEPVLGLVLGVERPVVQELAAQGLLHHVLAVLAEGGGHPRRAGDPEPDPIRHLEPGLLARLLHGAD